MNKMLDYCHRI